MVSYIIRPKCDIQSLANRIQFFTVYWFLYGCTIGGNFHESQTRCRLHRTLWRTSIAVRVLSAHDFFEGHEDEHADWGCEFEPLIDMRRRRYFFHPSEILGKEMTLVGGWCIEISADRICPRETLYLKRRSWLFSIYLNMGHNHHLSYLKRCQPFAWRILFSLFLLIGRRIRCTQAPRWCKICVEIFGANLYRAIKPSGFLLIYTINGSGIS